MSALEKQLLHDLEKFHKNKKLKTIFIGGGTPSCVKAEDYKNIFKILEPYVTKHTEITSEANPNSASYEWLEKMYDFGVNRISFGVQSFNDEKLKFLGRSHNRKSAIKAIQNAKRIGFKGINCDIIYGVYKDSFTSLKKDFDMVSSLETTHLSAYSLTIEEGTKFFKQKSVKIDDEDLSYKIFSYLEKLGFKQYEISNFSKDKKYESKHNYGYWEHENYLGVGAGAVGYVEDYRYYPKKDIQEYIDSPLEYEKEYLQQDDIKVEKVLLGFRCSNGVDLELFTKDELKKVELLIKEEKVFSKNERIYNNNYLLADELALFILP